MNFILLGDPYYEINHQSLAVHLMIHVNPAIPLGQIFFLTPKRLFIHY